MKNNIFINRYVMACAIAIVITLVGLICMSTLPIEQYPNIAPPTVRVSTSYTGADANTIMKAVVQPLEENINGVPGMTYITSSASASGDVSIQVYFEQGTDPDLAAVNVQNRPDIKLADLAMAEAFYNTQVARAAFYPSISLQGIAGWTNSGGGVVVNPGKILLNAVASLAQPIYAQGKLKANLKINQLAEEEMMNRYVQTVIDAGSQVNDALADCQAAVEKHDYYHRQVKVLKDAYRGTHELMDNGKASYLEVLTAQESLLNAQLNEAMNMYNGAQGIIALYIALGGATR